VGSDTEETYRARLNSKKHEGPNAFIYRTIELTQWCRGDGRRARGHIPDVRAIRGSCDCETGGGNVRLSWARATLATVPDLTRSDLSFVAKLFFRGGFSKVLIAVGRT
jgi:hypothetical protein